MEKNRESIDKMEMKTLVNCICIIEAEADLTLVSANDAFYQISGYTKGELQRRYASHMLALLEPDIGREIHKFLSDESQQEWTIEEHSVLTRDGTLWACSSLEKLKDQKLVWKMRCIDRCKDIETRLNYIEQRHEFVADNLNFSLLEYSLETGEIQYLKPGMWEWMYHKDEDNIKTVLTEDDIFCEDSKKKLRQAIDQLKSSEKTVIIDLEFKAQHGQISWGRIYMGRLSGRQTALCLLTDISVEKEASIRYLDEECFYQSVLSDQDAYGHIDVTENKILRVGGLWYGYSSLIDKMSFTGLFTEFVTKVVHPEDRERYIEVMDINTILTSFKNGIHHMGTEFRRIVEQNHMVWMELTIHLFNSPITGHVMGLILLKNVDEKHRWSINKEPVAEIDHNTGLYCRTAAESRIIDYMGQMRSDEICTLVLFQVDDFETLRYECGSEGCKEILIQISSNIKSTFRSCDVLGHYGGQEFLIFIKSLGDIDIIQNRIEIFQSELEKISIHEVTASIGIVQVTRDDFYENILQKANVALYVAQTTGKNRSVNYEEVPHLMELYKLEAMELKPNKAKREAYETVEDNEFNFSLDSLIGNYGDMAYLVNPRTYELMEGNRSFYNRLGKTEHECDGKRCYELLHGRTSPCAFCRSANWSTERFYMYKNYNKILEQEFLIKNKLVNWKGREVLMAVAVDLSNDKNIVDSLGGNVDENESILSGIQSMQTAESVDGVLYNTMEAIGMFYGADAVHHWTYLDNAYHITSSWSSGRRTMKQGQGDEKLELTVSNWLNKREWKEALIVENQMFMLSHSLKMHRIMIEQNIENEWWLEWNDPKGLMGFIELDNVHKNAGNYLYLSSFLTFALNEWKKRELSERIAYSNIHDILTGVGNRNSYEAYLNQYRADDVESIAAVVVNVNGMKDINSDIGVEGGNQYLKELAETMKGIFASYSVARLNGDEFLVLIENETQETVEHLVGILEDTVEETGSFTIATGYSWDGIEKELESTVNYATQVMRQNKQRYYELNNQEERHGKTHMLKSILDTINSQEMEVYLQPKVDSRTGALVGAEALVRLHHKEYGVVPPIKFIGQLEKQGLVRYVDLFVFERTLEILDEWKAKGYRCPRVSVNISRITLTEQNLHKTLDYIMSQHGITKDLIELEITESYEDVGKTTIYQAARKLHKAGYLIALDDFGTKYTNLSILSDIHVDVLKLDKSLVNSMIENEKNRIILENIIHMCSQLEIEVIAEGVETKAQEEILGQLGCHLIQGYLYSKPIPQHEFETQFIDSSKN